MLVEGRLILMLSTEMVLTAQMSRSKPLGPKVLGAEVLGAELSGA